MQRHQLREIAKFGAGLITGDFLVGVWFLSSGYPPFTLFGVTWTLNECLLWMAFDAVLIAFLVFYGWHITDKKRSSSERLFLNLAGCVFALVALVHLSRLIFGWGFIVGTWEVPYWMNMVGAIVGTFLSFTSFHFAKGEK